MPDPFDLTDGTDEGADDGTDSENKSFAQLRQHARNLEKQVKSLSGEIEPLRAEVTAVREEKRTAQVRDVFTELELKPSYAKLFTTVNPDGEVTKEAVVAFAKEYDLIDKDAALPETPAPQVQSDQAADDSQPEAGDGGRTRGFEPTTGGNLGVDASDKVGRTEWLEMVASDPTKAQRLFNEGRVDMSDVALTRPSSLGA